MIPVIMGQCPICRTKIFENGRALPNQCQFPIFFMDGTKTDLGVCIPCFDLITYEQITEAVAGVVVWWAENGYYPENPRIVGYNRQEVWNKEMPDGTTIFVRP